MTVVAQAQGVHPLYAGLDDPIGVDETGTRWAIAFQGRNAILTATFAPGVTLEFKIPTTNQGGTKAGSVAAFTIPNFGDARWVAHREHVKFEVRFPTPPKVTGVSVNIARQNADIVSDGQGGLDVLSGGVKVGALPQPWIDYTPDGATEPTRIWLSWTVAEPTMSLTMPTLTATEWATAVLDPTVITTSTAGTATAYSNQRKIDRTSNGVLWAMYWDGTSNTTSSMHFRYSTDDGATWSDGGGFGFAGTGTTYTPNGSLFIDLDDNAHVAYKDRHSGAVYYRRGTPNAGRTAWTWGSAVVVVSTSASYDLPDLAAHREGTGWSVHVVLSFLTGTTNRANVRTGTITSGGSLTWGSSLTLGTYSTDAPTAPSVDFSHTGDGKTVAGGTPHLYAAWSAGLTGGSNGIRFKKATYSGGSWTWGTEQEVDSASFANAGRLSSMFDGTRVVIAYADSASPGSIKVRERDAADTTTTTLTPTTLSDGVVTGITTAHDATGNLYLAATGATSADPKVLKYDRAAGTWGAWETLATATTQADTLTAGRYADAAVDFLYTSGTGSPYSVTYDALPLVTPQHESGGAASGITVTAGGAGVGAETPGAGAAATVTVAATGAGSGTEAAISSAATVVTVTTTGDGNAATENSAGARATVTIATTSAGIAAEQATGGNSTTITVTTTGGTLEPQTDTGGAAAVVTVHTYAASSTAEHGYAGATALVAVDTTGGGYDPAAVIATPGLRIYRIPAENRSLAAPHETRTATIAHENRATEVPA